MSAPKYLTGDAAGIKDFVDQFDVQGMISINEKHPTNTRSRSFCSIVMVWLRSSDYPSMMLTIDKG